MIYPINYDFTKNWDTKIRPYLNHPTIRIALRKGIKKLIANGECHHHITKYDENIVPAECPPTDAYRVMTDRQQDLLINKLLKSKSLPEKYDITKWSICPPISCYNNIPTIKDNMLKDSSLIKKFIKLAKKPIKEKNNASELLDIEGNIITEYYSMKNVKYNIESYIVFHCFHTWVPVFMLELAKLIEPGEEWKCRSSKTHTTIINKNHTKTFDIYCWAYERLENYLYGDPLPQDVLDDKTLGGKEAYISTT